MELAYWFLFVCVYGGTAPVCTVQKVDGLAQCVEQAREVMTNATIHGVRAKAECDSTAQWV